MVTHLHLVVNKMELSVKNIHSVHSKVYILNCVYVWLSVNVCVCVLIVKFLMMLFPSLLYQDIWCHPDIFAVMPFIYVTLIWSRTWQMGSTPTRWGLHYLWWSLEEAGSVSVLCSGLWAGRPRPGLLLALHMPTQTNHNTLAMRGRAQASCKLLGHFPAVPLLK